MSIRDAYERHLLQHGHTRDPSQSRVVDLLGDLQDRLVAAPPPKRGLAKLLSRDRNATAPIPGLYIWGGVGRGKTFLMDLFFETLAVDAKHRAHFHRFMKDVHERLGASGDIEDPLATVGRDMAARARVLCFDEFFVSDIGDAMILGRLLRALFENGVTLVATSNTRPDDLYRDGLQRQRFVPAIDALNRHTRVVELAGDTDYRLQLLQQAGTYLTPDDGPARERLREFFRESASSQVEENHELEINGRAVRTRRSAKGIAWFDFGELCDGPRSQADYIEIARWYPTIILSGVPELDELCENQARRFIALVDEFYDRHVKLIVSAERPPDALYTGKRLRFEFERTVSRLIEMQSIEYLHLPHLA
ncbi:MAG TPA: cell division protein ZapE [Woeseiaceae bacterium]|nr:cell division protein ZapE [Woeseiaceae bacterium]